ncbi:MAG: DUF4445 domain-containing protein [Deltaproteobacteria bacterium]|nr:DUF4445 domain-containing protein [Deltaproteobacteria bacterium]
MKEHSIDQGSLILKDAALSPLAEKYHILPPKPALGDNVADVDRIKRALRVAYDLNHVWSPLSRLAELSARLRDADFDATITLARSEEGGYQIIDLEAGDTTAANYGLAIDLGTTTIVFALLDVSVGRVISQVSAVNPQVAYGADILTRIHCSAKNEGHLLLRRAVIDGFNQVIHDLVRTAGIKADNIYSLCVAGNTTMTHFFLGLDTFHICREPYIPVVNRPDLTSAAELGIDIHPAAPCLIMPNVGSYFGGDLIAGILASGLNEGDDVSILVDVGTNAEVVLGNKDWLVACAGAAGPALEGGVAKMGMMAGPGTIERIRIDRRTLTPSYSVIGDIKPIGICGSGLIDLLAELFTCGIINSKGKFILESGCPCLVEDEGIWGYRVVPAAESGHGRDVIVSEVDITILLASKAAMYTILRIIPSTVGLDIHDMAKFYVAGTFGNYIDPEMAITIGMIPDLPRNKYQPLMNSSLTGAALALLSAEKRARIPQICDKITYVELNVNAEFMTMFAAAKFIPHTDLSLFPTVTIPKLGAAAS